MSGFWITYLIGVVIALYFIVHRVNENKYDIVYKMNGNYTSILTVIFMFALGSWLSIALMIWDEVKKY